MSKISKMLTAYVEMLEEYESIIATIESLPRGYISTKVISGHTYHYRQWRDGAHVRSDYVNDNMLAIMEQKITIRKEYEVLQKIIKKDLKKLEKILMKANLAETIEKIHSATHEERVAMIAELA